MDPHITYEYLTRARQRIFDWVRLLTSAQYTREFPIGPGAIARTLTHILMCEWIYAQRMQRIALPPFEQWPIRDDAPPAFPALEAAWRAQETATRAGLRKISDWNATIEYQPALGDCKDTFVTSPAMLFSQLAFHEVHHRAQVMNMLRHLGVELTYIDFNDLMETRRPAGC